MTPEEKAYIRYRLSKAQESLDAAKLLLEARHLTAAVNRLYYACFYSVSALLLSEGQSSTKHSGVRALFDRDWVKTGRIPKELGRFYRHLFDRRQEGDYADLVTFNSSEVTSWLQQAVGFVTAISKLVEERLGDKTELCP